MKLNNNTSFKGIVDIRASRAAAEPLLRKLKKTPHICLIGRQKDRTVFIKGQDALKALKEKFGIDYPEKLAIGTEDEIKKYFEKNKEELTPIVQKTVKIFSDIEEYAKKLFEYVDEMIKAGCKDAEGKKIETING